MYIGLHVKYGYSRQILMKREFSGQTLEKYSNIKSHENSSDESRAAPANRRKDTQT
jgi:hypothetical protein